MGTVLSLKLQYRSYYNTELVLSPLLELMKYPFSSSVLLFLTGIAIYEKYGLKLMASDVFFWINLLSFITWSNYSQSFSFGKWVNFLEMFVWFFSQW